MSYQETEGPEDLGIDGGAELALRRAGIPVESALGRTFARSYQGPEWDADSIVESYNALVSEVGGRPLPTSGSAGPDEADLEAAREREAIQQGGVGDTGQQTGFARRRQIVEKGLNDLRYSGKTREDVAGDVFGELIAHAIETGDGIIPE